MAAIPRRAYPPVTASKSALVSRGLGRGRAAQGWRVGVPPARTASLLSLRARPAPPAGVRAGPGGAARQGAAFPRAGRLRRADPGPGQGAGFSQVLRGRALAPTGRAETPRSAQGQPAPCSPVGAPRPSCFPWIALVTPRRKHFRFPQFLRGKVRHREGRSPTQGHTARKWPRWDSNPAGSEL